MLKAIIFDLDGVIVDTTPYHFKAWKKVFNDETIKFNFQDYVNKVSGLPRRQGILNIIKNISAQKLNFLMEKKPKLYLQEINKNPPKIFDGFLEFLEEIKKIDLKVAVASSSKNAKYILEKVGILNKFDAIITGNDFKKSKPDPEIFLTAAKKLKIAPCKCLVFEDAAAGIQAAKNAKMKAVGFASADNITELNKVGADMVIKKFGKINSNKICNLYFNS